MRIDRSKKYGFMINDTLGFHVYVYMGMGVYVYIVGQWCFCFLSTPNFRLIL